MGLLSLSNLAILKNDLKGEIVSKIQWGACIRVR